MSIHQRIKQIQLQSGLSLRKFEHKCGINRNVIAIAIKGEKSISHATISKIHKAYPAYSLDWIFLGYGPLFAYLCDCLEITKYELAKKLGYASLDMILIGRNEMGPELAERVLQLCPHINRSWLLKGTGEMLIDNQAKETIHPKLKKIPTIHKNTLNEFSLQRQNPDFIGHLPISMWELSGEFSGNHFCFEIHSDSMDDGTRRSIMQGDFVLCREIEPKHWDLQLDQKDWNFVILHKKLGLILKKIIDHDLEQQTICCGSLNKIYDDTTYNLNEISAIYNVMALKRSIQL